MIAFAALAGVLLLMLVELRLSVVNERALLDLGARQPPDPVYTTMRIAYPAAPTSI